jgi:phosphoglycolate phosphatase
VIDHHIKEKDEYDAAVIKPYLGSCATVVWQLLTEAGYDIAADKDLSTVLYYGLYMDTNNLAEIFHPVDRDMLDSLQFDAAFIRQLKNSAITQDELLIAGRALGTAQIAEELRNVTYKAEPCDPNILGFISDLTMQVDGVDTCVGFTEVGGGVKMSIRSCTGAVMANDLAGFIAEGAGSGGGNAQKAGGFLKLPEQATGAFDYVNGRIESYFTSYDVLHSGKQTFDVEADGSGFGVFAKLPHKLGCVKLTRIYEPGTEITVRTLEGDAVFTVDENTYLMVGIQGEMYPIYKEKFEASYTLSDEPYTFDPVLLTEDFYEPTLHDNLYRKPVSVLPYAKACIPKGSPYIWAKKLTKRTKVFTPWYSEGYMHGKEGDYLAVRDDDRSDCYIIEEKVFAYTYKKE